MSPHSTKGCDIPGASRKPTSVVPSRAGLRDHSAVAVDVEEPEHLDRCADPCLDLRDHLRDRCDAIRIGRNHRAPKAPRRIGDRDLHDADRARRYRYRTRYERPHCRPTLREVTSPAAICPILIERDRELALLHRVAAQVALGTPRLVVVTGESGAGKSRLIAELIASLDDTWKRTITSASSSRRPFADVISRAQVGPDTPHVEIGRALAAALPAGPNVVVIDDAHLLDSVTLRALGVALDLLEGQAMLVVVGFRSGASDATPALVELRRHPNVVETAVRPLSRTWRRSDGNRARSLARCCRARGGDAAVGRQPVLR